MKPFYYGVITLKHQRKNNKEYLGCDNNSGGYPYISKYPNIFYDTDYLKNHYKSSYITGVYGEYTLTIYEVNPESKTLKEITP